MLPDQRRLANLLRFGKGSTDDDIHRQFVSRDTTEAVALYREAAARGDPEAQFVLAQVRTHICIHTLTHAFTYSHTH
jgi:TPR repeat protein